MNVDPVVLAVVIGIALFLAGILAVLFPLLRLWIQAHLTHVRVSLLDLVGMKIRRTPPELIIRAAITLMQRNLDVPVVEIEACYLGHRDSVKNAMELATLVVKQRADAVS
jgi:uncharacterized protein YqfA (UPF0365 family)